MDISHNGEKICEIERQDSSLEVRVVKSKFNYEESFKFYEGIAAIVEEAFKEENKIEITIDLHQVVFVDSTCMGILVRIHQLAERKGGGLVLRNVNSTIMHLLNMTRLSEIFKFRA